MGLGGGQVQAALIGQSISTGIAATAPEPATWLIMILGFGMIGSRLCQGKRAAQPAGQETGRPVVA